MTLTADQISTNIVNALHVIDPAVSAEVGTPELKMIDANAEIIASQQVDFTVLNQQTDITTLSGGRLDAYLSTYNFGRQQAIPSTGTVTFGRNISSTALITMPAGTQVQANLNSATYPSLVFVTIDAVVLEAGSTSIDALVQCTIAGSIGNIDANSIVGFAGLQSVAGISSVTNAQAFSGGADQETDAAYVIRFQNTFMRNISGTTDMFLALAVAANAVTKANVLGPISRYQEYIQIPSSDDVGQDATYDPSGSIYPHKRTSALSTIPYTQYAYDVNYYLTDSTLDPATATFYRPNIDFVFNVPPIDATNSGGQETTTPVDVPNVTFLNPYDASANVDGNPALASGDLVLLEHAYISAHSRNNPSFGIYNCVDVYINGEQPTTVSSQEIVPNSSQVLQDSTALLWTYQNLGVHATDTVGASGTPGDGNTVTVNGIVYTFKTSLTGAAFEAHINGQDGSLTNLSHAINASGGTPGTDYGLGTTANPYVTAGSVATHIITLTAILVGTTANSFTLAKSGTNLSVGAGTFSGGINQTLNFVRQLDSVPAAIGSLVEPLYWQPVLTLPQTITVGSNTYYLANYWDPDTSMYYNQYDGTDYTFAAHYIFVEEMNSNYGTLKARNGIEWFLSGDNYLDGQLPSDSGDSYSGAKIDSLTSTQFTVDSYSYDQNVANLQAVMEQNKQTTQDVLVHHAKWRYFQPLVTVMYSFGVTQSVVNASVVAALGNFFDTQYYGAAIQMSDILQVIHNVAGVDNVRWTNPDGNKMQEVSSSGIALSTPVFFINDFFIQDNELAASPSGNAIVIVARAANTF